MNKKQEKIIWIVFCSLVFAGLFVFFVIYRPVTIFDMDDWTYLNFTRNHNLLPSTDEWNPTRILPENLFPATGYLGKFLFMPVTGDFYTSITISISIMLCIFVFSYITLMIRAVAVKFNLSVTDKIVLTLFLIYLCFISYLSRKDNYSHLFMSGLATNVFYYEIPNLLNVILVCLSIIHEDYLRSLFKKEHPACKIIYVVLIYFAIFSNLYTSIVFASYSAAKILQYVFIEAKDYKTDHIDKLIQSIVYIYALLLWFMSLIFEVSGGRAAQISRSTFDLIGSIKAMFSAMFKTNILFQLILISSLIAFIVLLTEVLKSKAIYLEPLMKRLRRSNKKQSKNSVTNTDTIKSLPLDNERFIFVNNSSLMMICAILTVTFLTLLSTKTGTGYLNSPPVQSDYYSFIMIITLMGLALLLKFKHKAIYGIIGFTIIMICLILFNPGTYSQYNYSPEKSKALCDYIIEQYVEADKSNKKAIVMYQPSQPKIIRR